MSDPGSRKYLFYLDKLKHSDMHIKRQHKRDIYYSTKRDHISWSDVLEEIR